MMTRSIFRVLAMATIASFLSPQVAAQATTTAAAAGPIRTLGCYSSAGSLTSQGDYTYQTSGYCQGVCLPLNKPVMAITGGSTCYCGDELPAADLEVPLSQCNSPCNGFSQQSCGGIGFWQVYLDGITGDVSASPNSTSSTTSGPTSSATTKAATTVVVTQSASAAPDQKKSGGGSSKVGIAVGVVVGVIAIAAIAGGILLWMRHKRNRDIEEEHRRNAAVSSFIGSQKSDKSSNDQRLDPSIYSHRRESIGSIADERDFSRRILQVCYGAPYAYRSMLTQLLGTESRSRLETIESGHANGMIRHHNASL
jgi:cell wall integrity and stress response component